MTDELRWILLGVGALLIVGLWFWESLRARRKPLADDAFNVTPPVRRPPTTTGPGGVYRANPPPPVAQEPVWEEPHWSSTDTGAFKVPDIRIEDDLPPLEPPLVQLPDHHAVESTAALPIITPTGSAYDRPRVEVASPVAADEVLVVVPSPAPAAPRTRPHTPPRQKIIALRLVGATATARFAGAELRQALEAEGLVFGRYHIFHREVDDKQLLFSVASLIEPVRSNCTRCRRWSCPVSRCSQCCRGLSRAPMWLTNWWLVVAVWQPASMACCKTSGANRSPRCA